MNIIIYMWGLGSIYTSVILINVTQFNNFFIHFSVALHNSEDIEYLVI